MEDEEREKAEIRKQYREASEEVAGNIYSDSTQSEASEDGFIAEEVQPVYEEPGRAPVVTESIIDRFDRDSEEVPAAPGLPEAPEEEPKKAAPKRRSRFTQVMA